MALLIVLICLVLLTILVVAFFQGSASEVTASKSYVTSVETQNLAATALNLSMSQVARATLSNSLDVSWSSQPGMIRNWSNSGTSPLAFFKLYTSAEMIVTGADAANFNPLSETPPADWDTQTAIYTDLNAPVGSPGDLRFPIVDPTASGQLGEPNPVDGFGFTASIAGANNASAATARLPMPVRWLYVLKNGEFVAPVGSGSTATVTGASPANPIVGRIAFWTDDESCKVNLNTASEGHFWDTPMASFSGEMNLNANFPAKNEFQRYAGHPSTTSLSTIFPWLSGTATNAPDGAKNNPFYAIAPRIQQGGSREGTVFATANDAVILDADRLYDNVDELAFNAARVSLPDQGAPLSQVSATDIQKRRFFLTSQSRSPEVTLFNTPRIAVWPLHANPAARHAAEGLIALASTAGTGAGKKEYHFLRASQHDPVSDFELGRNRALIQYLQELTGKPIPGYGRSFLQKWGAAERDQILIEIYDFIRSCINLRTKVLNGAISSHPSAVGYSSDENGHRGNVFPTALPAGTTVGASQLSTDVRGFGRFPSIKEVSMLFACEQDGAANASGTVTAPYKIWPAVILEMFLPSQGPKPYAPNLKVTVSGLDSFQWEITPSAGGTATLRPMFNTAAKTFTIVSNEIGHTKGLGGVSTGYISTNLLYYPPNFADTVTNNPAGPTVDNWATQFRFLGGTASIVVEPGDPAAPSEIEKQKFVITFPPMARALPNPRQWSPSLTTFTSRIINNHALSLQNSGVPIDIVKSMVVRHGDFRLVAASSDPLKGGDAANAENVFVPHRHYEDGLPEGATPATHPNLFNRPTTPDALAPFNFNAHTLHANPAIIQHAYADTANYVVNPPLPYPYFPGTNPGLTGGINGAMNSLGKPGDWDNGLGNTQDGPFINKPDEGLDEAFSEGRATNYLMYANMFFETDPQEQFFGPMRQIASPVMFGSLPTGVKRNRPWETLLFCPNPASGWAAHSEHPGFDSPPDHLLLDFFWMPATEPYAISDAFSTAGKVNLNYQILPFTYITRDTGLRAVLAGQKITAFREDTPWEYGNQYMGYKNMIMGFNQTPTPGTSRHSIDATETLRQFTQKFSAGGAFRSATEICEMFLVPQGSTLEQTTNDSTGFWSKYRVTGDNMRERPYNAIYPRVTTRSNVYTVYVKTQSIRQRPETLRQAPETFTEGRDIVEGEFQASFTFERYLDPNAPPPATDMEPLGPYKMRVINQRNLSW